MCIFYPSYSLKVYIKQGSNDGVEPNNHSCDEIRLNPEYQQYGISEFAKSKIKDIIDHYATLGPYRIRLELIKQKTELSEESRATFGDIPSTTQIATFKRTLVDNRGLDYGSLHEMLSNMKWNNNLADEDTPFVIDFQVCIDSQDFERLNADPTIPTIKLKSFRFAISTIRLLKLAAKYCLVLQIDSTYKLLWFGNPVLIGGMSDLNNRFHPFILCVCTYEESYDYEFLCQAIQTGITLVGMLIGKS